MYAREIKSLYDFTRLNLFDWKQYCLKNNLYLCEKENLVGG